MTTALQFNVQDYGALGIGGTSDDATAIGSAMTAAAACGGKVVFPATSAYYRIISTLTVPAGVTLEGAGAPEIRQATALTPAFTINGDNVTIRGLTITGLGHPAPGGTPAAGIYCVGTSVGSGFVNLTVEDCLIQQFSDYGIYLKYATDFRITGCTIRDIYYAGILGLSAQRGLVAFNRVQNIVGTPNAYGIGMTRESNGSLTTDPRSSDVRIIGNYVSDIPAWEGIDTHGGQRITIMGNQIYNTYLGIVATSVTVSNVETFAPLDVVIANNVLESGVSTGSRYDGIQVVGAESGTPGSTNEYASGCVVSGNTIIGYGATTNGAGSGGIFARNTRALVIVGNNIVEPSPYGIVLRYDNQGFVCQGNTIVDSWTSAVGVGQAPAIYLRVSYNRGIIGGNSFVRGAKAGTWVLDYGIRLANGAGQQAEIGQNWYDPSITPINRIQDDAGIMVDSQATVPAPLTLGWKGTPVRQFMGATASLAFGAVGAGATVNKTMTVTDAADGDVVSLAVPIASQAAGMVYTAFVSAAGTVTVRAYNSTGATVTPATASFKVLVAKLP